MNEKKNAFYISFQRILIRKQRISGFISAFFFFGVGKYV